MKYNLFTLIHNKTFFLIIFFIIINQYTSNITFIYPNSLFLSNMNIFIIHKYGISICDSNLISIIRNITVFENELTEEDLPKIAYSYEYEIIITIIKDGIYIFDNEGSLLYKNNTKIISSTENPSYYTLVQIKNENNYYYYVIGFNYNNYLHFLYYKYYIVTQANFLIFTLKNFNKNVFIANSYNIFSKSLTCQYMKKANDEALTCSFLVNPAGAYYIVIALLDVYENRIVDRESSYFILNIGNDAQYIKYIKSSINMDHSRSMFCCVRESGEFSCIIFIFSSNYEVLTYNYKCLTNYNGMKMNYFKTIEKSSLNCIDYDKKQIFIFFFNNTFFLESIFNYQNDFDNTYDYSILYNKDTDMYYIISDLNIENNYIPLVKFSIKKNNNKEETEIIETT